MIIKGAWFPMTRDRVSYVLNQDTAGGTLCAQPATRIARVLASGRAARQVS
jgi:hypothetical protein